MKKIIIAILLVVLGVSTIHAAEFTYRVTIPVDIDAIPNNRIVQDGITYNIRYYKIKCYVTKENGSSGKYIGGKVVPISNSGYKTTLILEKTFDHALEERRYYSVYLWLCENNSGNPCVRPQSFQIEQANYISRGTFTRID